MRMGRLIALLTALKVYPPSPPGEGGVAGVTKVNNRTGDVTLSKSDVGLGNVQNLAPADMPVSSAQQAAIDNAEQDAKDYADVAADAAKADAIAAIPANTDGLAEGVNPARRYFTDGRAVAALLAGLNTTVNSAVTAADSVLIGIGKLQAQLTAAVNGLAQRVRDTVLTGLSTATATAATATDTVLEAIGKLQAQVTAAATNFAQNVRGTALDGFSTATATAVTAIDTVLTAAGKLQAQITAAANALAGNVRGTLLDGLSTATTTAATATDSILIAIGKLQGQINNVAVAVRGTTLSGLSTASDAVITSATTILQMAGQLQAQITNRLIRRETGGTDLSFGSIPDQTAVFRDGGVLVGKQYAAMGVFAVGDLPALIASLTTDDRGVQIAVTGIGNVPVVSMTWNGTKLVPTGGQQLLYHWTTSAAVTTTGAANQIAVTARNMVIPGIIGSTSNLFEVRLQARWPTILTDNILRVLIGTTSLFTASTSGAKTAAPIIRVWNKGSLTALRRNGVGTGGTGLGTNTSSSTTYDDDVTVNTAADWTISMTVTGAAATTAEIEMAQLFWMDA